MIAQLSAFLRSIRGNAAIEFSLIAPVMLLLVAGVVEFGMIFKVYNGTSRLASQYASTWSDCSDQPTGRCQTELADYSSTAAIGNVVPYLASANVTLQMFQVQMSGTTPTIVYSYPLSASLNAAQTTAARAAFASGQTGVVITVGYQHSLRFFSALMTPLLSSKLNPSYTVTQLKS